MNKTKIAALVLPTQEKVSRIDSKTATKKDFLDMRLGAPKLYHAVDSNAKILWSQDRLTIARERTSNWPAGRFN